MRQLESFFWGIIAALGALFIELLVFIGFSAYQNSAALLSFSQVFSLPQLVVVAACTEELFKYLIIYKRIDLYSLEKSYIVNALFVGLGFAATEFWLITSFGTLPPTQILGELAIIHLGTSGIIGYIIATKNPKRISTFLYAIFIATLFHSGYNLLIQKREFVENYLIFLLLGLLVFINILNFLRISRKLAQG